jgi:hypothetical protein
MAEFDLIPQDYARNQVLRRRVKWFVRAVAAVVLLTALARLGLALGSRHERAEVARLRQQSQIAQQEKARVNALRQQKLVAEEQLRALDKLRGRDRVRLFLDAMDAAYINGIWFDQIRYYRSEVRPTGNLNALPGGAHSRIIVVPKENLPASAAGGPIEQHVELFGHALNHSLVAEFMRALDRQPGIVDLRLLDTGLRTYVNAVAIDFKLTLRVDEKAGRQQ